MTLPNLNILEAEAKRLGFSACGVALAEPVAEEVQAEYSRWIAEGRHGEMSYLEKYSGIRFDPRALLEGARSVISLAMSYAPAAKLPENGYRIAAYALGRDYHEVMKERMRLMAAAIMPDAKELTDYRICVDTAPILERYWAVKAGIGWTGRNRQLIIPNVGSMVFLGEIITTALPHPDSLRTEMANRCGQCRKCVEACPTGALSTLSNISTISSLSSFSESKFDASRCLSYETIEKKGELSEEAKKAMGEWIYGCDRCQEVCPWNQKASPTTIEELKPSAELTAMTKEEWHNLTPEKFRQLFKGSAVKRAKYEGLRRNIDSRHNEMTKTETIEKEKQETNGKEQQ